MATLQDFFNSLPDLRNGDAATYQIVHVASGIPEQYHTYNPEGCPIPRTECRLRIRLLAALYAVRLEDQGLDANEARAQGCILACVREGIYGSYAIAGADLVASQVVAGADHHWNGTAAADARVTDDDVRAHFVAIDENYLTDEVVYRLVRVGMGMLPCTGVVLVKTDNEHHFVDPHKSVHRAVLTQVMGRNYATPFNLDKATFEDVVCHKAAHCVATAVAVGIARRAETRVRLLASNLGSAGVRVPALYNSESAASAMMRVAQIARSLGEIANVNVDVAAIHTAVRAVSAHAMDTPQGRSDSATAQAALVAVHGEDLAFCVGMIRASCSHAGQMDPPILKAWSIKSLVNDSSSAVTRGVSQMEQSFSVSRSRARRGIIGGVGVFGAEAPPDTEPLPADETIAQILAAVLGSGQAAKAPGAGSVP